MVPAPPRRQLRIMGLTHPIVDRWILALWSAADVTREC